MTNKQLQEYLKQFDDNMQVKLLVDSNDLISQPIDFNKENVLVYSKTAWVDDKAPVHEWDAEDGKVRLGRGKKYLLINPIIR